MSGGDYIDQARAVVESVPNERTEIMPDEWNGGYNEVRVVGRPAQLVAKAFVEAGWRPVGSRNDAEQALVALRQRVAELEQDRADLIKVACVGRGTERYIRFTPDYGSERVRRLAAEVWRIDLDRPWHTCHPDWPGSNGCTADECGRAVTSSSLPSPGGPET